MNPASVGMARRLSRKRRTFTFQRSTQLSKERIWTAKRTCRFSIRLVFLWKLNVGRLALNVCLFQIRGRALPRKWGRWGETFGSAKERDGFAPAIFHRAYSLRFCFEQGFKGRHAHWSATFTFFKPTGSIHQQGLKARPTSMIPITPDDTIQPENQVECNPRPQSANPRSFKDNCAD